MEENTLVFIFIGVIASFIGWGLLGIVFFFVGKRFFRTGVQRIFNLVIERLLQDKYPENLMELWGAVRRSSILNILEISLRAESGKIIKRPLGSPKTFPHYDTLMFVPAQMARFPVEAEVPVDMKVKLGPKAKKPLTINIPLMISAMAYGLALSEEAKQALARGAKLAGTAINSGEGPFLKEERNEAGLYIWQIGRGPWGKNLEAISLCDMVEVQMGHGARIGVHQKEPNTVKGKARKLMGLSPVEAARSKAVTPGIQSPWEWREYVKELRQMTGGKPVGLKIMAGGRLEADLAVAIEAGFDVIALGGAQGASHAASPIMQDDFGIPTLQALVRANNYLKAQGVRDQISLISAAGYYTPGECLKALALGADAIYLGTVPLFALVHKQLKEVLPWEPLTQLVYYDSKYKDRLNVEKAAQNVANVLKAMALEMEEGIRGLGKTSINEVGPNDLVALDDWTAELTGVPRA